MLAGGAAGRIAVLAGAVCGVAALCVVLASAAVLAVCLRHHRLLRADAEDGGGDGGAKTPPRNTPPVRPCALLGPAHMVSPDSADRCGVCKAGLLFTCRWCLQQRRSCCGMPRLAFLIKGMLNIKRS